MTDELSTVVPSPITRWGGHPPSPTSIHTGLKTLHLLDQVQLSRDTGIGLGLGLEGFEGFTFSLECQRSPALLHGLGTTLNFEASEDKRINILYPQRPQNYTICCEIDAG